VKRVDQRVETGAGISVQSNGAADDRSRAERNEHERFDRHMSKPRREEYDRRGESRVNAPFSRRSGPVGI
jgi:hypothetical protein